MFDKYGRYMLHDYQKQPAFTSFLPGIAGALGIPIWCYYNNRGQGVCSFGGADKDHAIMEFSPARESYRDVARTGFRTFSKINGGCHELFTENCDMHIGTGELEITCAENGLEASAVYFGLPEERAAALVRILTVRNTSGKPMSVELLDGMPELVPYGVSHRNLKDMNNLAQAWMRVETEKNGLTCFKVRASLEDSACVTKIDGCNFCLAYDESFTLLRPLVQTELVFGTDTSLSAPKAFFSTPLDELCCAEQASENRFPCCFLPVKSTLEPNGEIKIYSIFGQAESKERAAALAEKINDSGWFTEKRKMAAAIIEELCVPAFCRTANPIFDAYCKQTFLDNSLRGGVPVFFEDGEACAPFYLYSRKHGDPEREYNAFSLGSEYYAQGNGNYRDVIQNRRSDVLFFPKLGSENIRTFFELIQPDGFNPLVLTAQTYKIPESSLPKILLKIPEDFRSQAEKLFEAPFTPGRLAMSAEDWGMSHGEIRALAAAAVCASVREPCADFSEGYWCDHWTYNLDLIESFLTVYPDCENSLLFEGEDYRWYAPPVQVLPRKQRYRMTQNGLRQYCFLSEPVETGSRWIQAGALEARSVLAEKLILLCTIKTASLDPAGMGIEMEGGRPGWYDALNGLPGLLGSSMAESCELARLLAFTRKALMRRGGSIKLFEEIVQLVLEVSDALRANKAYVRWDGINNAKERYRNNTASGFSGKRICIDCLELARLLEQFENTVQNGINAAISLGEGIIPTYFTFSVGHIEETENGIMPAYLSAHPLPLFLEAPVRWLKLENSIEEKQTLLNKIRGSDLYDRKLHMYKVNGSLDRVSYEVGRAAAFTPGWLENESIWLHMEYKYLLEMLKSGLYGSFAEALRNAAVPFLEPARYGRSPLENVSFIASSANPDPSVCGRGFVARMSGSSAEFLQMMQIMFFGRRPFRFDGNTLSLTVAPFIPDYLMPEDGIVSAVFLGKVHVIYHAHGLRELMPGKTEPAGWFLTAADGTRKIFNGSSLSHNEALSVRNGEITEMVIKMKEKN